MEGAHQHEIGQVGGAAVFPVPEVVSVQTAGGPAAGNRAAAITMLQRAAQPAADRAGRPPGTDDPTVALEPDLAGGLAEQVTAFVV